MGDQTTRITETELRQYLDCTDAYINSLNLPELKRIWPAMQTKEEEVRKRLEKHEKELARLEQLTAMVTLKRKDLEQKLSKQASTYAELGAREIEVEQEISKIQSMIPYYMHMVNNMFSDFRKSEAVSEEIKPTLEQE